MFYIVVVYLVQSVTFCVYLISSITEKLQEEVVDLIRQISSDHRNISQNPVLYCLAVCARSDHKATKTAAFQILNDVCRIPTHLFQVGLRLLKKKQE